jgi:hypothetical protein
MLDGTRHVTPRSGAAVILGNAVTPRRRKMPPIDAEFDRRGHTTDIPRGIDFAGAHAFGPDMRKPRT